MGGNIWTNGRKTTISRHFRGLVPVPNSMVLVPYWFWSTGTGTENSVPIPNVLFQTNVSILAITWLFLIRFELFKLMVKLDFKENKTPEIGTFKF